MRLLKLSLTLGVTALLLSGCSGKPTAIEEEVIVSPHQSYKQGLTELEHKHYKEAADHFEKIYFQHPGDPLTPQAEIMQAYSLYKAGEYGEARDILEEFINMHPLNKNIAYAHYLKCLVYYMEIVDVSRDQSISRKAKQYFMYTINKFPNSEYADDLRAKVHLVDENLAGQEMVIGRFYLRNNNILGATKRFNTVITEYQSTSQTPEALSRLVESYLMLGLKEEAIKCAAVLGHNYADSHWYAHAYHLIHKYK